MDGATGDAQRALELLEALLPDQVRFLRANHPNTLATQAEIDRLRVP